jgi:HNH endonuclease
MIDPVTQFWARISKSSDTSECWSWQGSTAPFGYGQIFYMKKKFAAHRLSWEIHFGPIPTDLLVCHKCDNPPCCNPEHLFLGNNSTNSLDMHAKGRASIVNGEDNGHALLTEDEVRTIRRLYAFRKRGRTAREIAERYSVSPAVIYDAVHRRTWAHID